LPKYLRAISLSCWTLTVAWRCSCKRSTLRWRFSRNLSEGYLSARRTSLLIR
jgi:hypothetical protein